MAINKFKKIQDHLGDLNDAQVVGQILEQFLSNWQLTQEQLPEKERRDAHAVQTYRESRLAEKEQLIASFQGVWDDFNQPEFRHKLAQAISVL
jgi:CHAD domain-containing protein